MDNYHTNIIVDNIKKGLTLLAVLLLVALVVFPQVDRSFAEAKEKSQKRFSSPEDAMKALVGATKTKDKNALNQILGPDSKELVSSGNEAQDASAMEGFAKHCSEAVNLFKIDNSRAIILVGKENWPFPIPIVKKNGKWFFDNVAGKEEILIRRIGENELNTIEVCRTYVRAQREYSQKDWKGDGIHQYAEKLESDPGKTDGLYWKSKNGKQESPMGPLVAGASAEGHSEKEKNGIKPTPYYSYYFKILTQQGPDAPGGKYNYIVNGHMTKGFALVAYPAKRGSSGVMTFIVNQQGKVYEKNLGEKTEETAKKMTEYNPDSTWELVKE